MYDPSRTHQLLILKWLDAIVDQGLGARHENKIIGPKLSFKNPRTARVVSEIAVNTAAPASLTNASAISLPTQSSPVSTECVASRSLDGSRSPGLNHACSRKKLQLPRHTHPSRAHPSMTRRFSRDGSRRSARPGGGRMRRCPNPACAQALEVDAMGGDFSKDAMDAKRALNITCQCGTALCWQVGRACAATERTQGLVLSRVVLLAID